MRLSRSLGLSLLAVPLAACASERPHPSPEPSAGHASSPDPGDEQTLPEVRYYMIADT